MQNAILVSLLIGALLSPVIVAAHSGGTNFSGCHYVWVNGVRVGYHCH